MHQEIEIKILDINKDNIITQIEKLGAIKIFDDQLNTTYFHLDDQNTELRIRKKGESISIDYKKYKGEEIYIHNDEIEVTITQEEDAILMFQKLGYTIAEKAQKHRVSYTIENIRIDFDKFDNIPRYLEIEGPSREIIQQWMKKLNLQDNPITKETSDKFRYNYQEFIDGLKKK